VTVGDWVANCTSVPEDECQGITQAFVGSIAGRATPKPGPNMEVEVSQRSSCPPGIPSSYADTTTCWQASAQAQPRNFSQICMIIARIPATSQFEEVGGTRFSGGYAVPKWWQHCT